MIGYEIERMDSNKIKKALIIQTAFIGDVILTTPVIEVLSASLPDVEIDFLTIPRSTTILSNNPGIQNIIKFDKRGRDKSVLGLWRTAKILQKNIYDLCIVPHRSLRSAFLAYMTHATIRVGFDRSAWKSGFTHLVPYDSNMHEIERNLSLLHPINIDSPLIPPTLYSSNDDKLLIRKLWDSFGFKSSDKIMAIAPGSVWSTKRWPEKYFIELCHLLSAEGFKPVLIGSREDESLCKRISKTSGGIKSIAGMTTLPQSYEFLSYCAGIVTNDSAPLHLGMASHIPVFAIFGPTVPAFGFAPFGKYSVIFEKKDLKCRPCSIHGGNKCPIKTFECMLSLKPDQLIKNIQVYFSNSKGRG